MPRYAAFLRAVGPGVSMAELRQAFESAGFTDVRTLLSTGNVVFTARTSAERTLERKAGAAVRECLGHAFFTIVRSLDALRKMQASDPYRPFRLKPGTKRVVTFLRDRPPSKPRLPIELHGARILALKGREAFSAYVPTPRGAVFMSLIEKTFGTGVTTRTWETVAKVAR